MGGGVSAALRPALEAVYGERAGEALAAVEARVARYRGRLGGRRRSWGPEDVVLIVYPDHVRAAGEPSLRTLEAFLAAEELARVLRILHLLPFYPWSSDDGFSVVDYRGVDQRYGTWADVTRLGETWDLLFDFVLNHVSAQSAWFQAYREGQEPYTRFFIEVEPTADLSGVVRPRATPLLTPVETSRGLRHVWTTFSADQVDLNYAEPAVLAEMTDVMLFYVTRGARILRLDAVAYVWKELGTPCIHHPRTHGLVRFFRRLVDTLAPGTLLLTETNVPHRENVSYFGSGDEAHLVYQFPLPPLLLDAYLAGDASFAMEWLAGLAPPPAGAAFLNFTASHDGIGLRPAENLLPPERLAALVAATYARGGQVTMRSLPGGGEAPYELNITYLDALGGVAPALQARRFLGSQALMLALQGVPAVYFGSLVGARNDPEGAARSGIPRRLHRRKFTLEGLRAHLARREPLAGPLYRAYRRLLEVRRRQAAFHPEAAQAVYPRAPTGVIAFLREGGGQRLLVAAEVAGRGSELPLPGGTWQDLFTGRRARDRFLLEPYAWCWLEEGRSEHGRDRSP